MRSSELSKKWILPIVEPILMMVIIAMLVESWINFQGFLARAPIIFRQSNAFSVCVQVELSCAHFGK
jgi:hypothetical protein